MLCSNAFWSGNYMKKMNRFGYGKVLLVSTAEDLRILSYLSCSVGWHNMYISIFLVKFDSIRRLMIILWCLWLVVALSLSPILHDSSQSYGFLTYVTSNSYDRWDTLCLMLVVLPKYVDNFERRLSLDFMYLIFFNIIFLIDPPHNVSTDFFIYKPGV